MFDIYTSKTNSVGACSIFPLRRIHNVCKMCTNIMVSVSEILCQVGLSYIENLGSFERAMFEDYS